MSYSDMLLERVIESLPEIYVLDVSGVWVFEHGDYLIACSPGEKDLTFIALLDGSDFPMASAEITMTGDAVADADHYIETFKELRLKLHL